MYPVRDMRYMESHNSKTCAFSCTMKVIIGAERILDWNNLPPNISNFKQYIVDLKAMTTISGCKTHTFLPHFGGKESSGEVIMRPLQNAPFCPISASG